MKSFTDIFIRHPVLAAVVNLVIVLVGWRALSGLPVQQYPQVESTSVVITTVYYGASAETVRGFLTTPIERAVSAIGGGGYVEAPTPAGGRTPPAAPQPGRRQHRHGAAQAEPQQHGSAGRGHGPAAAGSLRAAAGSRAACGGGAAKRPALRHVLSQLHLARAHAA